MRSKRENFKLVTEDRVGKMERLLHTAGGTIWLPFMQCLS